MSLISKWLKIKKGIIKMTTNETTEKQTNQQIAESAVHDLSVNDLVKEVQRLLDEKDYLKEQVQRKLEWGNTQFNKYSVIHNTVTDFIKEHVKDDEVDIYDLKELAEELNIELTKSIRVTFNVRAEYEFNVPLDWTDDDISDGDFNIRISHNGADDEMEETSESYEVEDFEVEDND
jgi:organic radical activating enzyme